MTSDLDFIRFRIFTILINNENFINQNYTSLFDDEEKQRYRPIYQDKFGKINSYKNRTEEAYKKKDLATLQAIFSDLFNKNYIV